MVVVLVPPLQVDVAAVALDLPQPEDLGVVGGAQLEIGHPHFDMAETMDRHGFDRERRVRVPQASCSRLCNAPRDGVRRAQVRTETSRDELAGVGPRVGPRQAIWVEKVVQGEATPQELVGWARQHYWGVTYHTRRVLSAWVTRIPYEMTDDVIENMAEEVLGTQSKSGLSHLHWLFEFTRALGAPDEVITGASPERRRRRLRELPLQPRPPAAVVRGHVRRHPRHREPDPARLHPSRRGVQGALRRRAQPDDYRFHTIHIYVDEEHGGHVGEFAERYLDTDEKRRSARAAYLAGAELTRRCWDAIEGAVW